MIQTLKNYLSHIFVALVALTLGTAYVAFGTVPAPIDDNRTPSVLGEACDMSSVTKVNIGHQLATQILATSTDGTRAYARVQVPANATNTVALGFTNVAALGSGVELAPVQAGTGTNGATTTPSFEFGLKTNMPYGGAVTAITNLGSTTVDVVVCSW